MRRDRYAVAAHRTVLNALDAHRRAGKKIPFLRDDRIAVTGIRFADPFGLDNGREFVGNLLVADVVHVERHGVNSLSVLIVAEFEFRFVHRVAVFVVRGEIGSRRDGIQNIDKPRALFSHGVGQTVFVVNDIRGRHHQLIDERRDFHVVFRAFFRKPGKTESLRVFVRFDVLTDKRRCARKVGRSHRRTGKSVVCLTGNRGKDLAAVRRDLGFDP